MKQKLHSLTYSEITNLWQQERTTREEWENQAKPIVQLKEIITPEIIDLIQKQRLGYLVEGTRFTKYSQRGVVSLFSLSYVSRDFYFFTVIFMYSLSESFCV